MKKMHFPIVMEIDEDGFFVAECPVFKACRTYGETMEDALENIKEVMEICLEEFEEGYAET